MVLASFEILEKLSVEETKHENKQQWTWCEEKTSSNLHH